MTDDRLRDALAEGYSAHDRRKVLKLFGTASAAGIAGLAGCIGDDGDDEDDELLDQVEGENDGDDQERQDDPTGDGPVLRYIQETLPTENQHNPYNPNNRHSIVQLFDDVGTWSPVENGWRGILADEWAVEGDTLTISLNPEQQWHNGEEVTAEDLRTKVVLERYFQNPIWEFLSEVSIADEKTLEYRFEDDVNETVALASLFHEFALDTPRFVYGDYLERLDDATTEDERDEVIGDLTQFAVGPDDVVGNAPWRIVDFDENVTELEVWEGHPAADQLDFDRVEWPFITAENKVTAILNDEVDYVNADTIGPDMQSDVEAQDVILRFGTATSGVAVSVDHDHEWFGRRKVRQALTYVLDGNQISANPLRAVPDALAIGIPIEEENLADQLPNVHDSLTRYEYSEENLETAASLLEEEGFYEEDGTWMTPDDEPFSISGPWPGAGPNPSRVQVMNTLLNDFGIEAEIQVIETATWGSRLTQCDYDWTHGFYGNIDPYSAFQTAFIDGVNPRPSCGESKEEYEVPWPPGDVDNDLQTVNVYDRIERLPNTTGEEATELVEELVWIFNQGLPQIPMFRTSLPMAFRADDWDWPAEDSPAWKYSYPPTQIPTLGELDRK